MAGIAWLTDIHLNFITREQRLEFYQQIIDSGADAVAITGDIAESKSVSWHLEEIANYVKLPIYFVLGNHDYYRGNVEQVRQNITKLCQENNNLHWLTIADFISLNETTVIVGQDGWADARYGDYEHGTMQVNDSRLITDLRSAAQKGYLELLMQMQDLADADAHALQNQIRHAVSQGNKKIVIFTHVPPFENEIKTAGTKLSLAEWLPFYASKALGDVLLEQAEKHPDVQFLVFSGHAHDGGLAQPMANLTMKVGISEYSQPKIQELLVF